jgi:hypothetical protein
MKKKQSKSDKSENKKIKKITKKSLGSGLVPCRQFHKALDIVFHALSATFVVEDHFLRNWLSFCSL